MEIRLNVRCSVEQKEAFLAFCRGLNLEASEVLRDFVRQTIALGDIPMIFKMSDFRAAAGFNGTFLERVFFRVSAEERDKFQEICRQYSLPMSRVVRVFFLRCLKDGEIPDILDGE